MNIILYGLALFGALSLLAIIAAVVLVKKWNAEDRPEDHLE